MRRTIEDYLDIIDLPRPKDDKHPPMPMANRAAQFMPFAALSGHGDAVNETGVRHIRAVEEELFHDTNPDWGA